MRSSLSRCSSSRAAIFDHETQALIYWKQVYRPDRTRREALVPTNRWRHLSNENFKRRCRWRTNKQTDGQRYRSKPRSHWPLSHHRPFPLSCNFNNYQYVWNLASRNS